MSHSALMNKRVQFNESPTNSVPSSISTPPVKLAMDSVHAFSETLHFSLAPVIRQIGEKHITLFKTLLRKNLSYEKLKNDDEHIPQSVNVVPNFKFRASKETKDTAEFASIQEATADIISSFCNSMKE